MCLFCIRGELKLIKENLIKINKEYDIYTKKGALKKFIDSKKNQLYQIIIIKDNKNKIKLKKLPVLFSIKIEKGTNLKKLIKNIQKILKNCYKRNLI